MATVELDICHLEESKTILVGKENARQDFSSPTQHITLISLTDYTVTSFTTFQGIKESI